jgi:hypothetical protein
METRDVAKNIMYGQLLANNDCYYHPADGIFNFSDLSEFLLWKWLGDKEIEQGQEEPARSRACDNYITICTVLLPWTGLLSRNLILRAFSDFPQN